MKQTEWYFRLLKLSGLMLALFLSPMVPAPVVRAQEVAENPPPEPGNFYLLFFGPEAPHFVCLQIRIDSYSPQEIRERLLEEVFKQTDTNENGKLEVDELKTVGGQGRMQMAIQTLINSKRSDIDLTAFYELLKPTLGIPFGMQASSARVSDLPDLFQKLDQDQNQHLSSEEWGAALQLLDRFDYDDDETLNLVEVMPMLRPLNFGQAPTPIAGTEAGLFRLLNQLPQTTQVAQQLVAQYDGKQVSGRRKNENAEKTIVDGQLNAEELGWKEKLFTSYDKNGDQQLSLSEIEQMLKSPPAQHTWRMRMPLQKKLSVRVWRARNPEAKWEYPRSATSRAKFRLGNTEFQISARNSRTKFFDVISLAQIQFLQADTNQDGQVSSEEYAMLRLPFAFENVDRDKNEMVSREEVTMIVQQDSALSQSQVLMNVDQQSESLFRLLDVDKDRRLEPRELINASQKMSAFDKNQDQQLTPGEMKSIYKLTFALEPPTLFMDQFSRNLADRIQPILSQPGLGPDWFQRMDRNLDGDLSPREFLGPTNLFVQFDVDQDGLIDPEEAQKIVKP